MVLSTVVVKSVYHGEKSPESWHFERLPFVRVREGSGEGYQKRKLRPPPSLFPDMRIGRFSLCAVHPCFFGGRGVVVG